MLILWEFIPKKIKPPVKEEKKIEKEEKEKKEKKNTYKEMLSPIAVMGTKQGTRHSK